MTKLIVCRGESTEINGIPNEVKILPLGIVKSQKGEFLTDKESFDLMYNHFKGRKIDIVIDYEHQTLEDVQAPAGGWIKDIYIKDKAIVAKVEWTPKATEYLQNKEYRYLSPVVLTRKTDKRAIILHSVALTNTPAIDGMFPIINSIDLTKYEGGNIMELEKLIKLLGLEDGATEEQVLEALGKLVANKQEEKEESNQKEETELAANKTICNLLGVKETAKTEDIAAVIMALKNPKDVVPLTDFTALKERLDKKDADDLVLSALKTGKISAVQKSWAEEYALKDPIGFKSFMDKAPTIVPVGKLNLDDDKSKEDSVMSDENLKICKMLGVTKEDIEKYGKGSE